MKLGDIKIEALKLMFANGDRDILPENLEQILDEEEFRDYLIAMPGAINRCFADLAEKRVLPVASKVLWARDGIEEGRFHRFSLSSIPDFHDVERLVYQGIDGTYIGDLPFLREGNDVLIENFDEAAVYRLLYRPALSPVTSRSENEEELPLTDRIAVWVPYFIKSELFRIDEPGEAAVARNLYEQQMAQIAMDEANRSGRQGTVRAMYDFSEV